MNTAVTVFKHLKGHFGHHVCLGNTAGEQDLSHAHTVTMRCKSVLFYSQAALGTKLIFKRGD